MTANQQDGTPRTDAAISGGVNAAHWLEDRDTLVEISRQLERELAAAQAKLAEDALLDRFAAHQPAEADMALVRQLNALADMRGGPLSCSLDDRVLLRQAAAALSRPRAKVSEDALRNAESWKGRADDAGFLSRELLRLHAILGGDRT